MRRLAATVASHLATPDGGRLDDEEDLALLNYGEHTLARSKHSDTSATT